MVKTTNTKKAIILETARELFWKHGFRRVSVEEICEKSKVSKMTFYRHFTNKIELAKNVFDNVLKKGVTDFKNIMDKKIAPEIMVKKILLIKVEGTNNISKEFLLDFYSSKEPELNDYVHQKTEESWREIIDLFKEAQSKGVFRSDFKPEIILYMSQHISELLNNPKVLNLYKNPQNLILELTNIFMYGIQPQT